MLSLRGSEVQPSLQSGSKVAMVLQVCISAWGGRGDVGGCRRALSHSLVNGHWS